MARIRCPFCHDYVDERDFADHKERHVKLRSDGQQTDYVTLPEDEREHGDLDDVPQVYVHDRCGEETGMPEDIIRSYLKDPWLYSADETFCCGCGKHVPLRQCSWVETDENLQRYFDRLRDDRPRVSKSKKPRYNYEPDRYADEPEDQAAQVDGEHLPVVDLRVGDGDGFISVLSIDRDRLVIGTAPRWNGVMLVGLIAAGITVFGILVGFVVRGLRPLPMDFCSVTFPMLGLALGVLACRRFRTRYRFDAYHNEIVVTAMFGLQRKVIQVGASPDVVIGSRTYSERTSGGWRDVDDPGIIYMIVFNRQGREILSIEGVRSDTAETAFYVLVAAKLASIFRVPLTFYDPPPEPYKSVDVLWTGIANADQRSVDRWFDKYAWTLKRRGLFRPEGVYALIGITTVLAFAVGIRWLSLTQALSTFGVMSGCVAMIAIGAVLCICGWQPGLRPSPMSRAGGAVFIHRSEVRIIIGSMLLFAAGTLFFLAPVIAMLREPPAAAFAREDRERTERDRPRFSYRVEVRPDGTRDVKFEHHNMKNTDVGLELMSKPEPEVREKGVYVLENAERDHPRRAEVVRALIPFLQHENKRTREVAVRGLGRWGYRDTIPELEPMLNDPDNQVRRAAAEAIRDINSRGGR